MEERDTVRSATDGMDHLIFNLTPIYLDCRSPIGRPSELTTHPRVPGIGGNVCSGCLSFNKSSLHDSEFFVFIDFLLSLLSLRYLSTKQQLLLFCFVFLCFLLSTF